MDSIISASSSTRRILFVAAGAAALVDFLARVAFLARFAAGIESTVTAEVWLNLTVVIRLSEF